MTICHRFISLRNQALLQLVPILSRSKVILTFRKNLSAEIDMYLKSIDESEESREKNLKGSKKTGKSREKIITLLSENGKLTAVGLAAEIGVTAKAIEKHLAKLKAEGIIEREGPDKGGSWKVK